MSVVRFTLQVFEGLDPFAFELQRILQARDIRWSVTPAHFRRCLLVFRDE